MSDDLYGATSIDDTGEVGSGVADGSVDDPTAPAGPAKRKRRSSLLEWIIVVAVALTSALLVRAFVVQQFAVDGQSMESTLHNGDRVLVNKLSYRLHDPRRGDVVVLKTIEGVSERDLIKRVVGLPGDTISYQNCVMQVNGRVLVEPYLDPSVVGPNDCGEDQPATLVEQGHVFVLGDNRAHSKDSRDGNVGQVPFDHLVGRAFVVIWPIGDWRWL